MRSVKRYLGYSGICFDWRIYLYNRIRQLSVNRTWKSKNELQKILDSDLKPKNWKKCKSNFLPHHFYSRLVELINIQSSRNFVLIRSTRRLKKGWGKKLPLYFFLKSEWSATAFWYAKCKLQYVTYCMFLRNFSK